MSDASVVAAADVSVELRRRGQPVRAVDGATFSMAPGEAVGLVGESGSGKTTLGLALLGLLPSGGRVTAGRIDVAGVEVTSASEAQLRQLRGDRAAVVFQDPLTSLNPTATVGWQVGEPLRLHRGAGAAEAAERAVEVLELVGLPSPRRALERYPHELSGGMRQRVGIAMALACEPALLIADEPTSALDVTTQDGLLALFDELRARLGMALLLITHDLGVVAGHCDRTLVMYGGRLVEAAPTAPMLRAPRHRYTQALLAVAPSLAAPATGRLPSIPGGAPDLSRPVPGCPFAPRCLHADAACTAARPPEVDVAARWTHACAHPATAPGAVPATTAARNGHGPRDAASPLLELEGVVRHFPVRRGVLRSGSGAVVHAVDGVDLAVARGETLAVVGESGCGKSTLGRLVVALDRPTAGAVRVEGDDLAALPRSQLRRRRRDLSLVFQDPSASLDPRVRVGASIAEPLAIQRRGSRAERQSTVVELLADVGLEPDAAGRYPHELSGGQRQRVGIARALALRPKLVVADEPVSGLDVSVRASVLNLLRDLQAEHGLTYLVISHDLTTVRTVADRLAVMYLGRVVETGPVASVYADPAHPYTDALLAAVPDHARPRERRGPALAGELPSAIDPPSGCRFRTRCPRATEVCAEVVPPLAPLATDPARAVACHHPVHTAASAPAVRDHPEVVG